MAKINELDEKKPKRSIKDLKKISQILSFVKPYKWFFIGGMFFLFLSAVSSLVFARVIGELVKVIEKGGDVLFDGDRDLIALFLLGILVIQGLASFGRIATFARVSQSAMADMRRDVFSKVISLPLGFFDENRVGELTSRLTADVNQIEQVLATTMAELMRQLATIVIGFGAMAYFYPKLTGFMAAIVPLVVIVTAIFGRYVQGYSKETQKLLAETNIILDESLHSIFPVKAFTNERFEIGRYLTALRKVVRMGIKRAIIRGGFITFVIIALMGSIVGMVWKGMGYVESGEMLTGDLVSFMIFTMFIGGAIGGVGNMVTELLKGIGATERVRELLDEESEFWPIPEEKQYPRMQGNIIFDDVRFSYPTRPDVEVLKGLSLEVKAGQKVALAGPSGVGKSTIIQLLLQLYQPGSGKIYVDGKEATDYHIQHLRSNTGIVPQDVILFGGTIRENIAYGRPGATEEEIESAADRANALEFINRFPEGLETLVGDRGVKLSGGQKQRIAIARAILKDPAILILDEATSSLDAESEKLVQDALDKLMQNRTTIIIAHRLSTIREVDIIYVLNKGVVSEKGTHEMLAQNEQGLYHHLLKLQFDLS